MGGIRVDGDTQMSTVPGLFAAGECAAGLHGANRLGGNSLSDLLVFGQRAGQYAAEYARKVGSLSIDEAQVEAVTRTSLEPFGRQGGENPYQIQHELQDSMQALVGIVRNESEMTKGLDNVLAFQERARNVKVEGNREFNPGWHTALDLRNLLIVSEAAARSALNRKESRGAHFREDFPEKSKAFELNHVVKKAPDGSMKLDARALVPTAPELQAIIVEMK
jgi:succinate dehydrogenase / fumarate reductase flavoprotein subunit